MNWVFQRPEYSDGTIDLIPLRLPPAEKELGFGRERTWRITEHGSRKEIGRISYRPGESAALYYFGLIGYHIDPPWRGHHYAMRACRLIEGEIRRGGKSSVVITCDPDNEASRKTIEGLGAIWESRVTVDPGLRSRFEISKVKERYIWVLGA